MKKNKNVTFFDDVTILWQKSDRIEQRANRLFFKYKQKENNIERKTIRIITKERYEMYIKVMLIFTRKRKGKQNRHFFIKIICQLDEI